MLISMNEACGFIRNCEDVVILIHQSPDGDCVGAGFAMKEILSVLGKRSRVVCSDVIPPRYDFLTKGYDDSQEFQPQTVIAVDIADTQLLGSLRDVYEGKIQLCIDHHISNTDYAEKTLLYPKASAACEVVYNLANELGVEISDHAAACIYTGMATDTGCFKFDNTTPECHEIAAALMRTHKLNYALINREMFDVKSIGRIKMESCVLDLMEYYFGSRLTMICLTADIMNGMGVEENELEGCANLPLQVEGVEVGIMLKERQPGVFKISMRSANDVNVSDICRTLGGGGHAKAAGCLLEGDIADVKKQLIDAVGKALGE